MQLARTQWLEQGLITLADQGPQHVKIDVLCKALGVTKGSFYHHFKHHAAFVTALLEHWVTTHTRRLIEDVTNIEEPQARGERLSELVYSTNMRTEVAMRAWARSHPEVAARVHAVDGQRLDYLTQLATQMGASAQQARQLAQMAYAQLVGIQHLQSHITLEEAAGMDRSLHAMIFAQLGKKR